MMAVVHDLAEAQGMVKANRHCHDPFLSLLFAHIPPPCPPQSATSLPEKAYQRPKSAGSKLCVFFPNNPPHTIPSFFPPGIR
jgi:hypothetical protein